MLITIYYIIILRRIQMLTLSKDMEIGVVKIDNQHKELVNRLNAVSAMGSKSISREETQKTINLLSDYVVKHFYDEELLQRQSGYPKYDWHKEQHNQFINDFQQLRNEFLKNGSSAKFTLTLSNSVIDWVVRHIKFADAEFGMHYNRTH